MIVDLNDRDRVVNWADREDLQVSDNGTVGDAIYIPPNAKQFISNCGNEPLIFICIVDPAWQKEDETVFEPIDS